MTEKTAVIIITIGLFALLALMLYACCVMAAKDEERMRNRKKDDWRWEE